MRRLFPSTDLPSTLYLYLITSVHSDAEKRALNQKRHAGAGLPEKNVNIAVSMPQINTSIKSSPQQRLNKPNALFDEFTLQGKLVIYF